jgi:hypothetical protein
LRQRSRIFPARLVITRYVDFGIFGPPLAKPYAEMKLTLAEPLPKLSFERSEQSFLFPRERGRHHTGEGFLLCRNDGNWSVFFVPLHFCRTISSDVT